MGMSRPSYGRGQGSFFGRRPPPMRNPQMPMDKTVYTPQIPQGPQGPRMPQIPIPQTPMPPMQRPGGPGKGRPRGGLMRRGRGRPMPGGPGKGRSQPQMPMPQQSFVGQMGQVGNNPPPSPTGSGEGGYGGGNIEGGLRKIQYQQIPIMRPGGFATTAPAVPDFRQIRTQGPMNMPPMNFPQPTARPNQTMGRPMPQPNFMPMRNMEYGMGFYGGGITDLY